MCFLALNYKHGITHENISKRNLLQVPSLQQRKANIIPKVLEIMKKRQSNVLEDC